MKFDKIFPLVSDLRYNLTTFNEALLNGKIIMENNLPEPTPTVSFIVPVYNSANYLIKCIDSILSQSIEKEIILIDDGSTDNSLNILLEYAQKYPFISLLHSIKNRGLSYARNKGLDVARGKYIYFVDSDDYLINDNLSILVSIAEKMNVDIIKAQSVFEQYADDKAKSIKYVYPYFFPSEQGSGYIYSLNEFWQNFQIVENPWIPGVLWTLIRRKFY